MTETSAADAAECVQAFLDARGPERHDVISTAGSRADRYSKPRLRRSDLLALLAERERLHEAQAGTVRAWEAQQEIIQRERRRAERAEATLAELRERLGTEWGARFPDNQIEICDSEEDAREWAGSDRSVPGGLTVMCRLVSRWQPAAATEDGSHD